MRPLLIITDLDGTLLDHDTYSFAAAAPALSEVRRRRIPLILASSKTRAEMEVLHRELGLSDPFICENGAAICTPVAGGMEVEALAPPRSQVLAVLAELRERYAFQFTGFADGDVESIAQMTGLDLATAALAAEREYSEPLRWEDSDERLAKFCDEIARRDLQAQQGGRFLSVSGPADKGKALRRLKARYSEAEVPTVVALGDSPNDATMLAAADIAVIIRSARSGSMQVEGPERVIRTDRAGPAGWQQAVAVLLDEAASD
jgi:mannosyl-3-phosphoglycerate phosphatase